MGKLDGKVAIITGGAGGIGSAAARVFAADGAKVMLVDLDEDTLQKTVSGIGEDQAAYMIADVSNTADTQAYVAATAERFRGVDISLLNAGIEGQHDTIAAMPEEMFDKVRAVNVRGVFLCLK